VADGKDGKPRPPGQEGPRTSGTEWGRDDTSHAINDLFTLLGHGRPVRAERAV
jgi:hypothetical protein